MPSLAHPTREADSEEQDELPATRGAWLDVIWCRLARQRPGVTDGCSSTGPIPPSKGPWGIAACRTQMGTIWSNQFLLPGRSLIHPAAKFRPGAGRSVPCRHRRRIINGHLDGSGPKPRPGAPRPRRPCTGGPGPQPLVPAHTRRMRRRPARTDSDWTGLEHWKRL